MRNRNKTRKNKVASGCAGERRCVNEDKTTNMDDEAKEIEESSKFLSFRKMMKELSPHRLSLKDRLKDKTVPNTNVFRPDPPPSRRDDETSRRLAKRK